MTGLVVLWAYSNVVVYFYFFIFFFFFAFWFMGLAPRVVSSSAITSLFIRWYLKCIDWGELYCHSAIALFTLFTDIIMYVALITHLHMRRECRGRFPHHRLQRIPVISDHGMHHGTCVTHVPCCMSGSLTRSQGETLPAFPAHAQPAILRNWQQASR